MPVKATKKEETYGIGAVSKMTGLSQHTIRIWERRYDSTTAQRASNGRRLYVAADVDKLNLLKALTDHGLSIGRIAAESVDELRHRVESISQLSKAQASAPVNVALLGDFLPAQLERNAKDSAPLNFVALETNAERFEADVQQHHVDVLIIEVAVIDVDSIAYIGGLVSIADAHEVVCVYNFATTKDIDRLRDSGVLVLHAPVSLDELKLAVVSVFEKPRAPSLQKIAPLVTGLETNLDEGGTIEPRRFNQHQLSLLANASTKIDCECPHQLSRLVGDLTAFEVYSANCANKTEDDEALHRYLHYTTARARALIELALERVAKAEKLQY